MQTDPANSSDPCAQPSADPVPAGDLVGAILARLRVVLGGEIDRADPIVVSARELYDDPATRAALADGATYRSLNPAISLAPPGYAKSTLFAGDVLFLAGFAVPTYEVRGWDGSTCREYRDAGRWPREGAHFAEIVDLWQVRPGDILIIVPEGGVTHAEVITDVAFTAAGLVMLTMGARAGGLEEDGSYGDALCSARLEDARFLQRSVAGQTEARLHVLRARKPLGAEPRVAPVPAGSTQPRSARANEARLEPRPGRTSSRGAADAP
jgi:hypothetical protein